MDDHIDISNHTDDELKEMLVSLLGGAACPLDLEREEIIGLIQSLIDVPPNVAPSQPPTFSEITTADTASACASSAGEATGTADDQKIESFMDITGSDRESARSYLEACAWDVEAALALYVPDDSAHRDSPNETWISRSSSGSAFDASSRNRAAGVGGVGGPLMSGGDIRSPQISATHRRTSLDFSENDLLNTAMHYDDEGDFYDEEEEQRHSGAAYVHGAAAAAASNEEYQQMHGVRRPDPVRQQRLVGSPDFFNPTEYPLSRADEPTVDWLFPPPRHLSFPGSFIEAKNMAKSEKKWVLVNIQSHEEFASHMLNRDTWSDETLESLVRSSFIFWQRGHTSPDSAIYMQLYAHARSSSSSSTTLPEISIIDSRTGVRILTVTGYVPPDRLIGILVEFLDENNFDDSSAPKVRKVARSFDHHDYGTARDIAGADEDMDDVDIQFATRYEFGNNAMDASSAGARDSGDKKDVGTAAIDSAVTQPPSVDYGTVPAEPTGSEAAQCVRVSIKLASGRVCVRKYHRSDLVRSLFAVAASMENTAKIFDLSTTFPTMSLRDSLDRSIEEVGVAGAQVVMRILED